MSGIIALFILGVLFGLFYAAWKGSGYLAKCYLKSKHPFFYLFKDFHSYWLDAKR